MTSSGPKFFAIPGITFLSAFKAIPEQQVGCAFVGANVNQAILNARIFCQVDGITRPTGEQGWIGARITSIYRSGTRDYLILPTGRVCK